MDPYAWSWNPEALIVLPALTAAYSGSLRRFPAAPWRVACFAAAIVLLLAVTITPIETIALNYLLSVHLIQNVVLAEWAPLLVVLGIPPALAALAPRVPPVPALALWVVNYGVWHLPWIYDAALRHPHSLLHLEHALYFVTGVLLWWPIVHGTLSPGLKAAYLFAAFLLASPIGLVMALVPERDLRLLRRGAGALGALPDRRPADRRRLDGGGRGSRLLRGVRVLLRPLLRRAGRGDLRTNVTSMSALPPLAALPVRLQAGPPGPKQTAVPPRTAAPAASAARPRPRLSEKRTAAPAATAARAATAATAS